MKLVVGLVFMAMFASSAAAAQEAIISATDPEALRRQFASWGYEPSALEVSDGLPLFSATISGIGTAVVLGGCTNGRNCSHMALIATYSDVPNPPYEWLNQHNFDYNLVTVMRRADGLLSLRSGIFLGNGVRVSAMELALQDWIAVNAEIIASARDAGLVSK